MKNNKAEIYWKKNLRYLTILLSIWFIVSFGFGILLADQLNEIQFFGFKLGFWFAQQGSIYTFVILIFVYIFLMNRLDKFYKTEIKEMNKKYTSEEADEIKQDSNKVEKENTKGAPRWVYYIAIVLMMLNSILGGPPIGYIIIGLGCILWSWMVFK